MTSPDDERKDRRVSSSLGGGLERDLETVLMEIAERVLELCEADTLANLDSMTVSTYGGYGLDRRGRRLFEGLGVYPDPN